MTVIIFLIVLSVIVFVHELGHFVMAKRAGMKVEEFGFGFPPRIWGYKPKKSETTYTINAIPFGGFVKILGEDGEVRTDPRAFTSKGFIPRASVIIAGVIMNVLLAAVLLSFVNMLGSRVGLSDTEAYQKATDIKIQITQVVKGSPAASAGMKTFDEIKGFGVPGQRYSWNQLPEVMPSSVEEVQSYIREHRGKEIVIVIADFEIQNCIDNAKVTGSCDLDLKAITIIPRIDPPVGEGSLGISLAKTGFVRYSIPSAITKGFGDAIKGIRDIVVGFAHLLKSLFTTGRAGVELAGPVGIAVVTGEAARLGLAYLLQLMAFISLNLAVINIVPFPALDGGRLLFLILEKIKGSPLPTKIERSVNTVGFSLLILLMFYITIKDVIKFF